jgi:hypothetical protein
MITIKKVTSLVECMADDLQCQRDTRLTPTPSFILTSNYVIMVCDWNCLKYFCVFFTVIVRCTDFLITLYISYIWHGYMCVCIYSGPSSYDRPDKRTTWVTTKILDLTYDQSLKLRPECRSRPKRVSASAVVTKTRDAFVSVSLSPEKRVCGRNFGQCSALYN